MAMHSFSSSAADDGGKDHKRAMRQMLGPGAVDTQIRHAISTCWMMLPDEKRNPEAVVEEIRRIVERALANLADDAAAFQADSDDPNPA
jgi:hypothetical protein